jgi:hypothetical protein
MKNKRQIPRVKAILVALVGLCLLFTQPLMAMGRTSVNPKEDDPASKTKAKAKSFASKNNSYVKIYPDPVKRSMHVVGKESANKPVDFFVFDMQGTLLKNYKMKAKDHIKIEGLAKGTYVYRVFSGDEETAAGNFVIR